jgi:hypothetical protein
MDRLQLAREALFSVVSITVSGGASASLGPHAKNHCTSVRGKRTEGVSYIYKSRGAWVQNSPGEGSERRMFRMRSVVHDRTEVKESARVQVGLSSQSRAIAVRVAGEGGLHARALQINKNLYIVVSDSPLPLSSLAP